jgi:hypothetical protein
MTDETINPVQEMKLSSTVSNDGEVCLEMVLFFVIECVLVVCRS